MCFWAGAPILTGPLAPVASAGGDCRGRSQAGSRAEAGGAAAVRPQVTLAADKPQSRRFLSCQAIHFEKDFSSRMTGGSRSLEEEDG